MKLFRDLATRWHRRRIRVFEELKENFGIERGEILPRRFRIVHALFFPIQRLGIWRLHHGPVVWDPERDEVRILNVRYSMDLFRFFRFGEIGQPFAITSRDGGGSVTIEKLPETDATRARDELAFAALLDLHAVLRDVFFSRSGLGSDLDGFRWALLQSRPKMAEIYEAINALANRLGRDAFGKIGSAPGEIKALSKLVFKAEPGWKCGCCGLGSIDEPPWVLDPVLVRRLVTRAEYPKAWMMKEPGSAVALCRLCKNLATEERTP